MTARPYSQQARDLQSHCQPLPREIFVTLKDKNRQSKKLFFICAGNFTRSLEDPSEMLNYIRDC